jgi:hypothetical protein
MAKNVWLVRFSTSKPLHEITALIAGTGLNIEHIQLQQGKLPAAKPAKQGSLPLTSAGKVVQSEDHVRRRLSSMERRRDHAVVIIMGILKELPNITPAELADKLNAEHPSATTRYHKPWDADNVKDYYWDAFDRLTTNHGWL